MGSDWLLTCPSTCGICICLTYVEEIYLTMIYKCQERSGNHFWDSCTSNRSCLYSIPFMGPKELRPPKSGGNVAGHSLSVKADFRKYKNELGIKEKQGAHWVLAFGLEAYIRSSSLTGKSTSLHWHYHWPPWVSACIPQFIFSILCLLPIPSLLSYEG